MLSNQEKRKELRKKLFDLVNEANQYASYEDVHTEPAYIVNRILEVFDQETTRAVESSIPPEKPMGVFSFVLKGDELELYMQHKGWNQCRDAMKQSLQIEDKK